MFNILDYFALCIPIYFVLKSFKEEAWKAFIPYYNYYTVFNNYYNRVYKIKWHIIYIVASISFVIIKLVIDLNSNIVLYLAKNSYLEIYTNAKMIQELLFFVLVIYLFLKPIIYNKKLLNIFYILLVVNVLSSLYYIYNFNISNNLEYDVNNSILYSSIIIYLVKFITVIFTVFLTYNFSNRLKSGEIELFEKLDTLIYDKEYINRELDSRNKILIK